MTEKEFINSINDMKVVLTVEQYDYLVQFKAKWFALERRAKNGDAALGQLLEKINEETKQEEAHA